MNWMKGFALVTVLALPLTTAATGGASAAEDKPSTTTEKAATPDTKSTKPSKEQMKAYQSKCSDDADAKGLFVKKGKAEERKKFRTECIKKLSGE